MVKRAFDLILSGAGLILSFPLWLIFSAFILITSGRPVFFVQKRIGKNGKVFNVYKFRTMNGDTVTRIGKILRATAMDELPQLWNIFKGDMSFVGPRALAEDESEMVGGRKVNIREIPGFIERCRVRPGLTGIAQVFAPKEIELYKKFRYDIFYIRKANVCLDLKLILMSFVITFFGAWEDRYKLPRFMWKWFKVK